MHTEAKAQEMIFPFRISDLRISGKEDFTRIFTNNVRKKYISYSSIRGVYVCSIHSLACFINARVREDAVALDLVARETVL